MDWRIENTQRCGTANKPLYQSWEDFLAKVPERQIREWCTRKAKKANLERLLSPKPEFRLTTQDVLSVLYRSKGRCHTCGSLCVEERPSTDNGYPLAWEDNGRRIGSLGHKELRFFGGSNQPDNLVWECLWCNSNGHDIPLRKGN